MNPFWTVSLFWIAAIVCVAIALAFVLPVLLRPRRQGKQRARSEINIAVYRDQLKEMEADKENGLLSEEQFKATKLELESRLAEDALSAEETPKTVSTIHRTLGYGLGVLLTSASFGLYFWLGNPMSMVSATGMEPAAAHPDMSASQGDHDFQKMIERVEEKIRANPDDGNAWALLAKSYAATSQWPQALQAYEKAIQFLPHDASVLSGYAEALAIKNNRSLNGKVVKLVKKALESDPNDIKGLELAGVMAFQDKNYAKASNYFKRLHALLPPDSQYAQDILGAQKKADSFLEKNGTTETANPAMEPPAGKPTGNASVATIKGIVDIAPELKSSLSANDVLFVFARSPGGGPPVAALRASANQLPLEFELNDSMAMNPSNSLSQQKEVMIVARISKTGSAIGQSGDMEGTQSGVKVGTAGLKIQINQVKP